MVMCCSANRQETGKRPQQQSASEKADLVCEMHEVQRMMMVLGASLQVSMVTCRKRLTLQGASAAVAVGGPLRQLHAVGAATRYIKLS